MAIMGRVVLGRQDTEPHRVIMRLAITLLVTTTAAVTGGAAMGTTTVGTVTSGGSTGSTSTGGGRQLRDHSARQPRDKCREYDSHRPSWAWRLQADGLNVRPRVSGPSQIIPAINRPETAMQPAMAPGSATPRS